VRQNKTLDIRINILFRNLSGAVFPFECGIGEGSTILNLLMVEKTTKLSKEKWQSENHFLGIMNVNNFLSTQYRLPKLNSDVNNRPSYENAYFCVNCFNKFTTQLVLDKHEKCCLIRKPVRERASPGTIQFKNFHFQHFQDFVGFLDFESVLTPESKLCDNCNSLRCKCDKSFSRNCI